MSSPDLADDIRALEEALAAGPTKGPWHTRTECPGRCCWHIFPDCPVFADGDEELSGNAIVSECSEEDGHWIAAASPDRIQRVLTTLKQLQQEQALAGEVQADAATQDAELQRLRDIATRYHWLCANLARIHIETTQPAGSPEDAPMRVTLMQVWPELPRTEAGSVDAAVIEAMKEGV